MPEAVRDTSAPALPRQSAQGGRAYTVVPESIVLSVPLDPYLPLKTLSGYCGLCVRKLREYLSDPFHPLPHFRVGGKILVRRSEFDAWMSRFRERGGVDVGRIADEAVRQVLH